MARRTERLHIAVVVGASFGQWDNVVPNGRDPTAAAERLIAQELHPEALQLRTADAWWGDARAPRHGPVHRAARSTAGAAHARWG